MTIETFPIEDGAFTVPTSMRHGHLKARVVPSTGTLLLVQGTLQDEVHVHASDIPRFLASLDALTGGGYRRAVMEEAQTIALRHRNMYSEDGTDEDGSPLTDEDKAIARSTRRALEAVVMALEVRIRALAEKG